MRIVREARAAQNGVGLESRCQPKVIDNCNEKKKKKKIALELLIRVQPSA